VNLKFVLRRRKVVCLPRDTLAQNLRRLRNAKGISQEELADLSGLHRTYVGSVERSERNISIDNIAKLATALDVSISKLLEGV
jgi:transcriptional regulator with XRE-family HTH domain